MAIVHFQLEFRPALPCVFASRDYHEFRETLIEMDRILTASGLEKRFILKRIDEIKGQPAHCVISLVGFGHKKSPLDEAAGLG